MLVDVEAGEGKEDFRCRAGIEVGSGAGPRVKVRRRSPFSEILSSMSVSSGEWLVDCLL